MTFARFAGAAAVAVCIMHASAAGAQEYLVGGEAAIGSGIEGGGGAHGVIKTARTRVKLGADLRLDESPNDGFSGALLADVQPRTAFGLEARYFRLVGARWAVGAGAIGYLAPATLFGASVDAQYRLPLGKTLALTITPEANVFPLGGDLPEGTVIWQGLLNVGIHVDL